MVVMLIAIIAMILAMTFHYFLLAWLTNFFFKIFSSFQWLYNQSIMSFLAQVIAQTLSDARCRKFPFFCFNSLKSLQALD